MSPARTALVHLVWAPAGLAPFEAFLASYRRHEAGIEHDLVLLFNGFEDAPALGPFRERAAGLGAGELVLARPCLDLAAYAQAAARLEHERMCVLNSYSEVLAAGWLHILAAPLDDPATGATAATGSWGSILGFGLWQAGFGGGYDCVFGDRRQTRDVWHAANGLGPPGDRSYRVWNAIDVMRTLRVGSLFPAVHLRTNAFCIRRTLLRELAGGGLATKRATYRLESGRRSLTACLRDRGLATLVVDRHGTARPPAHWPQASVFWQEDQQDLLVGDNQTRLYDAAAPAQRDALRGYAWGLHARPPARPERQ